MVDSNSSLASLTVTDDQLTLTTTDGNHCIDRLNARSLQMWPLENTRPGTLGTV